MRSAAKQKLLTMVLLPVLLGVEPVRTQTLSPQSTLAPGASPPPAPGAPRTPGTPQTVSQAPGTASQSSTSSDAPALTLEDAVQEAYKQNRLLKVAELETSRTDNEIAATKALYFPQIHLIALGGQLLEKPSVYLTEGSLGEYPGSGPIPAENTTISAPRRPVALVFGQVNMPLSQRFQISLGIRLLEATKELRREQERELRHDISNQVRRAYYQLLQLDAQLETAELSIKLFEEAQRVARHALEVQAVLPADVMDVDTRLAQSQLQVQQLKNGRDTLKEQINQLIGRPIDQDFRTQPVAEAEAAWGDLAEARRRAVDARPELAEAKAKLNQASLDRKLKASAWIPNVDLTGTLFTTFHLTNVVPANLAVAGFLVDWEPLTWGRRKAETEAKSKVAQQASLGVDETRTKILVEVGADYRSLEEARLQLKVARLGQDAARERLRVAQNQFRENVSLLKDLLEAQTKASDASSQYAKALSGYWTARANFEKAIGE